MNKVIIIIPTYNEDQNISILLRKLDKLRIKKKIIIVDDSNNDLTKKSIKSSKIKNIYIKRVNKKGRGSAVIHGIKKMINKTKNNDLIVEMDADLSHNPNELINNIKYFKEKNLDLLISSRYLNKSKILNWDHNRKILSKMSNFLAHIVLQVPVSDYTNGYIQYSRRAAQLISKKCGKIGDGFIILSEILLCIYKMNYNIDEVPTIFVNRVRGSSNVNLILIFKSLLGLIRLFLYKNRYN